MNEDRRQGSQSVQQPLSHLSELVKPVTLVSRIRQPLLAWVQSSNTEVARFQHTLGVSSPHHQSPIIFYSFKLGAALGDELFYLIFLPTLFWCYDETISRRLILLWLHIYYLGQYLKDTLQLPRPTSPPVFHLEHHYITEYGLPSTHAMAAVSMPIYILIQAPPHHFYFILPFAMSWVILMTLSRPYLGVHSFPDIYVGLFLGVCVLLFHVLFGFQLDHFLLKSAMAPVVSLTGSILLILIYPAPVRWTTAFGDTTLIIGATFGVSFGSWIKCFVFSQPVWEVSKASPGIMIGRLVVGIMALVFTRAIAKSITVSFLRRLYHFQDTKEALKTYRVEIPTKFITYCSVGLGAVIVPEIFNLLQFH